MNAAAQNAFKYTFKMLTSGADLMIPETSIEAVNELTDYATLTAEKTELLEKCVMVKLNGGLGTGMGLEKAKSLLDLKEGNTFLDFIALQVREQPGATPWRPWHARCCCPCADTRTRSRVARGFFTRTTPPRFPAPAMSVDQIASHVRHVNSCAG